MPSVLFASHHFYPEPSSGAMAAMRDLFYFLGRRGWERRVVCGGVTDAPGLKPAEAFAEQGLSIRTAQFQCRSSRYALHRTELEGVPVVVYEPEHWTRPPQLEQGYPFLQLVDRALTLRRPDVLLTFGGNWMGRGVMAIAARHGVPVVFWLRNTEYNHRELFDGAAAVIVPSQFSADLYREKLGIQCKPIHSPIRIQRVLCPQRAPRCATFICPNPQKGAFFFARIAVEIGRLRPDMEMLVVVGRGSLKWFEQTGLNLRLLPNFRVMPATSDPKKFWSRTRVLLAPSLWMETFMRVAAEAMSNGIPVLGSRRGAIPGTLGDSGFLFDIPAEYTPAARRVPSAEEVAPWVQTLIRLWDDAPFYEEQSTRALRESRRFHPDVVIGRHEEVLRQAMQTGRAPAAELQPLARDIAHLKSLFSQPPDFEGAPILPLEADGFIE